MKKIVLLSVYLLSSWMIQAQPKVTSAFNANKEGKYEEAKQYIDDAMADPKATEKEKFWRYRGNIYCNIVKDTVLNAKYPDALTTALAAYKKYFEIDKRQDYKAEVYAEMEQVKAIIGLRADRSYKSKKYCKAGDEFLAISQISAGENILDTVFIFNSAFCYNQCGNDAKALEGFQVCASKGYNVRDSYLGMSNIYLKQGNKEEAIKILTEARKAYPKDAEFLRAEVNIYIDEKNYTKAQDLLKALTETDPKNESVWFVLGVTYEKENNPTEAEKSYSNALAIKPDYYDAAYNMGAMYYNQAQAKSKVCNEIPPRESAKYDACKAELKPIYLKAAGYFEICYQQEPGDAQLKQALKETYLKGGDREKSAKFN
jgi:tetratricopeptide (TPR) repeat protein